MFILCEYLNILNKFLNENYDFIDTKPFSNYVTYFELIKHIVTFIIVDGLEIIFIITPRV